MAVQDTGRTKLKIVMLFVMVGGISILHYTTQLGHTYQHIFYRELYFIPLILGGLWFGLRGGLITSLIVSALYLPFVFVNQVVPVAGKLDKVVEIVLFNTAAIITGLLRDQEKAHQLRMREAERLAAIGKAVSGLAHDIKTPLLAIGGYTNLVRKNLAPFDPNKTKLDVVIQQTQRLEAMVKDMLDFSKPLDLQIKPTDLNKVLDSVFAVARAQPYGHGVELVGAVQGENLLLNVDSHRLEQALINLTINAVQASPPGKEVTLEIKSRAREIVIEVKDRGPGIPKENQAAIFDPFFTTKKDGTGLGLPIVKKIVEAHHGKLELLENPGGGITVRIILPQALR